MGLYVWSSFESKDRVILDSGPWTVLNSKTPPRGVDVGVGPLAPSKRSLIAHYGSFDPWANSIINRALD